MGGVVAPMVAAESDDISFIVLMAGYGIKTSDLMHDFRRYIESRRGKSEEEINESVQFEKTVINKAVMENWSLEKLTSEMRIRAQKYFSKLSTEETKKYATFEDFFKNTYDYSMLRFVLTPFYRQNLDYVPAKTLEKVTCPVLMFFAEDDPQVTAKANAEVMKQALENGGNSNYKVKIISNANHFFTETRKPLREFTPGFLEDLSSWILLQVGDGK